jgi:hypothetical protein
MTLLGFLKLYFLCSAKLACLSRHIKEELNLFNGRLSIIPAQTPQTLLWRVTGSRRPLARPLTNRQTNLPSHSTENVTSVLAAYRRMMNCPNAVELRNVGNYLYEVRGKWENKISKIITLGCDYKNPVLRARFMYSELCSVTDWLTFLSLGLFNDASLQHKCVASNDSLIWWFMNWGRKRSWSVVSQYVMGGLRKIPRNLSY